ncbi:helix-turn-helix domain-containing protein [Allopusillimonas soli]|uniref:Helix-turn-helix domain-containing protein n=1 Tax=Allopusillimonas soli TaxID=659016 RepID=A0A853F430_9BURK|nr:helix-turn-helix domain-containing protein [Allopusillimonas soli]NYT35254.1 helix-turn-helix domain-containing protein [Allopusillimonas soli]
MRAISADFKPLGLNKAGIEGLAGADAARREDAIFDTILRTGQALSEISLPAAVGAFRRGKLLAFAGPPGRYAIMRLRGDTMQRTIAITSESTRCSTCMLSDICLPVGMAPDEVEKLDELVKERIRVSKGATLFSLDDPADAVYGIRFGSLKTQLEDASGHMQITGFLLPGEILGMDGLLENRHVSNAVALEDSEVCVIRIQDIDHLSRLLPSLQQQFRRFMSKEINRSHQLVMSLGSLRSEQRLAAFLMNMSQRLTALGYSSTEFLLRMSREEIGNYLGLTLETVSRLFSRFAREGLIRIQQREVHLLDLPALLALSGGDCD